MAEENKAAKVKNTRRVILGLILALTSVGTFGASSASAAEPQTPVACYHAIGSVYRLYTAYFLREPEEDGFHFWNSTYNSGQQNMVEISDFFATSEEFNMLYGSIDNLAFVNAVYYNVMGRPGDAEGVAYWTGRLDRAELSRGEMMLMFSESGEYVAVTRTAPSLAGYFAWFPTGTTTQCGRESAEIAITPTMAGSDLLIVNDGPSTERVTVMSKENGVWSLPYNLDLDSGHQVLWMGVHVDPTFEAISISAGPNVSWLVTQYPTQMPLQRNPWSTPDVAMATIQDGVSSEVTALPIIAGTRATLIRN